MEFRFDPQSYSGLDRLGRIALSKTFHMREFLYSEIAVHYKIRNVPTNVGVAVQAGSRLCQNLLEPLQDAFGRIHVRSGYRSREVNRAGVEKHGCAIDNDGFHTWDFPTSSGRGIGAVACISIPFVSEKVLKKEANDMAIAWWILDHLADWSCLEFFATSPHGDELTFNIGWHERPMQTINSWRGGPRNLGKSIPAADERKRQWQALVQNK